MKIGLIKTSLMENEHRAPIYPEHLARYTEALRKKIFLEVGYGKD